MIELIQGDIYGEILFRGKRVDKDEWIEGCFVHYEYTKREKDYIITHYANDLYALEIIPETLGQYTGLKDKNGKRIFEGDIVKLPELYSGVTAVVKWAGSGLKACEVYAHPIYESYEVIGNKYDNPELLEDFLKE